MPPRPRERQGHHRLRCARACDPTSYFSLCRSTASLLIQIEQRCSNGGQPSGFDPKRTFIFSDYNYMGGEFYKNCVRIAKARSVFELFD